MALKTNIDAAAAKEKSDIVLKNGFIINVFDQSIEKNDVAIKGNCIIGIGKYDGKEEVDCTGLYISPGFIDSHVHIESSMMTPFNFSKVVIEKGVTTVIADPHEIANVMGLEGIRFMIDDACKAPSDIFFMLPSCVPATDFEDNGAKLDASMLSKLIKDEHVLGLGEVMDVPSVIEGKDEIIDKINLFKGRVIDGHCPEISDKWLNAYLSAGITTDHESSTCEEALKKVRRGMYVLVREGSAAKNLKSVIKAVNDNNYHRFLFCTDDRHIEDLIEEGSIDYCIRKAVKEGINPVRAVTMATYNAAECYGLKKRGAVAPGYKADLVILEDLNSVKIKSVIKDGKIYDKNSFPSAAYTKTVKNTMNMDCIDERELKIPKEGDFVNVIKIVPDSIYTLKEKKKAVPDESGMYVQKVDDRSVIKIGVFERHKKTGRKALGYIEGLGIKNCAVAQTIAHDSHNIIAAGDNDEDMALAVNSVIQRGGGIAFVSDRKLLHYISLPIGGLITYEDTQKLLSDMIKIKETAKEHGISNNIDPFLTLGFMALPVVPQIKITSRGIFDYDTFKFINLFCQK